MFDYSWQGCQSLKITFEDKDIECDVQEIRELLDESKPKDEQGLAL